MTKTVYSAVLTDGAVLVGQVVAGKLSLHKLEGSNRMPLVLTAADVEKLGIILCKFLKAEH